MENVSLFSPREGAGINDGAPWCMVWPARPCAGPPDAFTDHLEPQALHNGNVDVYLCGPPPMVDAVQKHFKAAGITPASFHYEKFSANVAAVPA